MITILTWYWSQPGGRTKYTAAHVNIWADMVRRNLSMPHRLACVTDLPDGIDPRIEIITPPRDFEDARIPTWGAQKPQCLRRLAMFRKDAGAIFGERFVCMDLDCIVSGPLDPLFTDDVDFKMCRGTASARPYNGSMMMLRAGTRAQVYDRFSVEDATIAGQNFLGSDQAWISYVLGPNERTWMPDDGVFYHRRAKPGVECRIMFFPGDLKPWSVVDNGRDQWALRHYRRDPKGCCLVLGRSETVWRDAEQALDSGRVDGVVALSDVAEYWPGKLDGIAVGYGQAERLARMLGFGEIVFCGRSVEGGAA